MISPCGAPGLFELEAFLKPAVRGGATLAVGGGGFGHLEFQQAGEFRTIEVQQQLAGLGFHGAAVDFDANAFAVGVQFEFSERVVYAAQLCSEGFDSAANLRYGSMGLAELDDGAEGEQFLEAVMLAGRNEFLCFEAGELFLSQLQKTARLSTRICLLRCD